LKVDVLLFRGHVAFGSKNMFFRYGGEGVACIGGSPTKITETTR